MCRLFVIVALLLATVTVHGQIVGKWRRHVIAIPNSTYDQNPFELELDATFTHTDSGASFTLPGYYDGDDRWKIGFMPTELGGWTYLTHSTDPDLDGVTGSLVCVASGFPGMLKADPDHSRKWRFTDGPVVVPMAFRMEIFYEDATAEQFTAAADFLATGIKGHLYETRLTDEHGINDGRHDYIFMGDWQDHQFDLVNWARFENRLEILTERGLGAHVLFYSDSTGAPGWDGYSATEELVIRYVVARLCGFPVIWFNTGIDINEFRDGPWVTWFGDRVRALDPYQHPVSSRHGGSSAPFLMDGRLFASEGFPTQAIAGALRDHFLGSSVPVSMDDAWGENRPSHPEKNHTAADIRRAFWKCVIAGGVGGLVRGSDGFFHIVGIVDDLDSEQWLRLINPFIGEHLGEVFDAMVPAPTLAANASCLADPDHSRILVFTAGAHDTYDSVGGDSGDGGPLDLHLGDLSGKSFHATWFDPRTGTMTPAGSFEGGATVTVTPPTDDDWVLLLKNPYGTNEAPVVSLVADRLLVSAGQTVVFGADASDDGSLSSYEWDLGGTIIAGSGAPQTTLAYSWNVGGVYPVALTVTDDGDPPRSRRSNVINITVQTPLVVQANADPTIGAAPLDVHFTGASHGGEVLSGGYVETGGSVTLEAEHFSASSLRDDPNGTSWETSTDVAGYVGDGYVTTPGPVGERATWENGTELTFDILFRTTGVYRIWVRRSAPGAGSNSCFLGLDGTQIGAALDNLAGVDWQWAELASVDIQLPGLHRLELRRREAEYRVDRIHLTRTTDAPTGWGPAESLPVPAFLWDFGDGQTSSDENPIHTFTHPGDYTATLTVTLAGESAGDTLAIQVFGGDNQPPQVDAGPDLIVFFDLSVDLTGVVTDDGLPDPPGGVSTLWSTLSGPGIATFSDPTALATTATFPVAGVYVLELSATDGGFTRADTVTLQVMPAANARPSVNAGPDLAPTLTEMATLSGTVTDDGLPSPPGVLTTAWIRVYGPGSVSFGDPRALVTTATFSQTGSYLLALVANDGELQAYDTVVATVRVPTNLAPAVTAGPDRFIRLGEGVALNGMVVDDGRPDPPGVVNTLWRSLSGPGAVTFLDPHGIDTSATFSTAGIYVLELSAHDGELSSSDAMTVTVEPPPNEAPSVMAGPDQNVTLPDLAFIEGTVTDDGRPNPPGSVATSWRLVDGPAPVTLEQPQALGTTVRFTMDGTYTLELSANDGELVASDTLTIFVQPSNNQAPSVDAGPDESVTLPDHAALNGTVTDDGHPALTESVVTFWSLVSGPAAVQIADPHALQTSVQFLIPGFYVLKLEADDGELAAFDLVSISVRSPLNHPPGVSAGPDQIISIGESVFLNGTVTDGEALVEELTPTWSLLSGPGEVTFGDAGAVDTTASFSVPGVYLLELAARDGELTGSDLVRVTVNPPANRPPEIFAGPDQNIRLPAVALLAGLASDDGAPNPPGLLATRWRLQSGPGQVSIEDPTGLATTVTFASPGVYVLELEADDGELRTTDLLTVNVAPRLNRPPTVTTGPDQSVVLPTPAAISGTVDDDGLPDRPAGVVTLWSQLGGPAPVTFEDPNALDTTVSFDTPGMYVLQLTAHDGEVQASDTLRVNVGPEPNAPPAISAGSDQTVWLPAVVTLGGAVADDGAPSSIGSVTVTWSLASGPDAVLFADPHAAITEASFTKPGLYVLRLTGDDGELRSTDFVTVAVLDIGETEPPTVPTSNHPPIVQAGPDHIVSPNGAVALSGFVADDGHPNPPGVVTTLWTLKNGPAPITLASPNTLETTAGFSTPGTYLLELRATDGEFESTDTVRVDVQPTANEPPAVDAGADQNIRLSETAILAGQVTDDGLPHPPGAVATFWIAVSGPGSVVFTDTTSTTTHASFATVGAYLLQLVAYDGHAIVTDTVGVFVSPEPNAPPEVEAGPDQYVVLGNGTVLSGTVTDDGRPGSPSELTSTWSLSSGPAAAIVTDASSLTTGVIFSRPGSYAFGLMADDGVARVVDTTLVEVAPPLNAAPWVHAGPDFTANATELTELRGTVTDDGFPIPPGELTVTWSVLSGPGAVQFFDRTSPLAQAVFSTVGFYILELAADDGHEIRSDPVMIEVIPPPNQPPTVDAGPDQTLSWGQAAALSGVATDDGYPEPSHVTTQWSFSSGPGGVTFGDAASLATTATFSQSGSYVLRLDAHDGEVGAWDALTILVGEPPNEPPVVDAGGDQTAVWGAPVLLAGAVTDDGRPNPPGLVTTLWSLLDGPEPVSFGDITSLETTVALTAPGSYVLKLTADDGGATAFDTVSVEMPSPPNAPPVVEAGPDQHVVLPAPVYLEGQVDDDGVSGSVVTLWIVVSGPGPVTFADPAALATIATITMAGDYVVALTAHDGDHEVIDTLRIIAEEPNDLTAYATADPATGIAPLRVQFGGEASGGEVDAGGGAFVELGGMVVIEAESFAASIGNQDPNGIEWQVATELEGFGGDGYITTPGPQGGNGSWTAGCAVTTPIRFTTSGSYSIWMRRLAKAAHQNSAYVGLDGVQVGGVFDNQFAEKWQWLRHGTAVDVSEGTHTFHIRRREAEYPVDRVLLTADSTFVPSGMGPDESAPTGYLFHWDFGDGNASVRQSPDHIYTAPGRYVAVLTVTAGEHEATDHITIDVTPPVNDPPIVDAGDAVESSSATVILAGSVTDDGLPAPPGVVTIEWQVLTGPGDVSFVDAADPLTTATFSAGGQYLLELRADDGEFLAADTVTVTIPNLTDEFRNDSDTVALYHLNDDFADAGPNGFHLAAYGSVELTDDNLNWMTFPAGHVARFDSLEDSLEVTIPDALILPDAAAEITIEAYIYPREYLAWSHENARILTLTQSWDASFEVRDGKWNDPRNPYVTSSNRTVMSAELWSQHVTLEAWHHLRVTYSAGLMTVAIDGITVASESVAPHHGRNGPWVLTLGEFSGDIDEVRISRVVRVD